MQPEVYLNGDYLPLAAAKISVLDRGFLFADSVYEVIPSYRGRLFKWQHHLQRLATSLQLIRLDLPYSSARWLEILSPLLSDQRDQYIYLQITRGVGVKRAHAFPSTVQPTVFAMSADMPALRNVEQGVAATTLADSRWAMCQIKATSLLANVLSRQQATEQGCAEAILHRQGQVTEGAASNIFALIDDVLITPKKTPEILPGITRQVVLELAKNNAIQSREDAISLPALRSASEIWMTSSTQEIVPVVTLDSAPVGSGTAGAMWHTMNRLFQAHKKCC